MFRVPPWKIYFTVSNARLFTNLPAPAWPTWRFHLDDGRLETSGVRTISSRTNYLFRRNDRKGIIMRSEGWRIFGTSTGWGRCRLHGLQAWNLPVAWKRRVYRSLLGLDSTRLQGGPWEKHWFVSQIFGVHTFHGMKISRWWEFQSKVKFSRVSFRSLSQGL